MLHLAHRLLIKLLNLDVVGLLLFAVQTDASKQKGGEMQKDIYISVQNAQPD